MKNKLSVFILLQFFAFHSYAQFYNSDDLKATFFSGRREALRSMMDDKSISVFFSNPIRTRSNDVDFQFSQNPNFYYLTGIKEPDAVLLIFKEKRNFDGVLCDEIVFIKPSNSSEEVWEGKRITTNEAANLSGIKCVYTSDFFSDFGINFSTLDHIYVEFPDKPNNSKDSNVDLGDLVSFFNSKVKENISKIDEKKIRTYLSQLREVKTSEEIIQIEKAIEITNQGLKEMIRAIKPGMYEYQSQAIVEYFIKSSGGEAQGYSSICGSGENSCYLHYEKNRKQLLEGELLLTDIGGEYHGYTADITRTFPVNGKFSEPQRKIYQLVLDAQNAGIKACRKGASFRASHEAAMAVISKGLLELGIIKNENKASIYFMHGTSHYLGLDVHDLGTYGPLKKGTVITVEPGIYIPNGSDCDKKWWNIGVRIEDDILVTDAEPINLSGDLPREINQIESLLNEESFLKY